ncbi:hypothetical protein DV736_g4077, partial [Chaetothyriales sp. CBS 134916]
MAPKRGNAAKTSAKPASKPSEDDYIVFTNKAGAVKPKSEPAQQGPPRPDARKIIGGASWTGKLPVNLLSEHCQRARWNKPEYSMKRVTGGAYRSAVTLSKTDLKTRETTTLPPFELPQLQADLANQESALEARHFAATYALFRVASMKNIHMTLPPTYRDLWKGPFQEFKKEDIKEKREWKYDADPFAAEAKRKEIRIESEKRKVEQAKKVAAAEKAGFETPQLQAQSNRIWSRAPRIDLGPNLRSEIESIVRQYDTWDSPPSSKSAAEELVSALKPRGFRESHIREAGQYCNTLQDAIDWLLIHVPEDDLPKWALPQNYSAGVTLASGNVANDAKIRRLMRGGFSQELCSQALKDNQGSESSALEALLASLVPPRSFPSATDEPATEAWSEELMALEAVYGESFSLLTPESCSIKMEPVSGSQVTVHFTKPSRGYPDYAVPLLTIDAPGLPAYIRLSATKKALVYAWDMLVGDAMIYSLVEYVHASLPGIIEIPGKLVDLEIQTARFALSELRLHRGDGHERRLRKGQAQKQKRLRDLRSSTEIREAWAGRQASPAQERMKASRQKLPAWSKAEAIVQAVKSKQVTLITGDTGSGKSTQSVQFILDEAIRSDQGSVVNILCTQPRRVAALALSDRVAEERCSAEGDEVGFIIKGASKICSKTKITFMTTGVLLRRLQLAESPQAALRGISHVFIDEVHERSLDTDFLLALIKSAMPKLPSLKTVLMSATVDAQTFIDYFGGDGKVARVHIEGRSGMGKAIQKLGKGINYDLIASLVEVIDMELGSDPGAILIFLPGSMEIDRCLRAVCQQVPSTHALPLHASLQPWQQKKAFPPGPKGLRKVICATNVAETSVTIPDVVAVIDTGRVKQTTYDVGSSMVRLQEGWASRAACKQRRGRAGRVQAGACYKLFTRNVESCVLRPQSDPEVKRVPLEQLCLSVISTTTPTHKDVAAFLRRMISPPDGSAVASALATLRRMGALEGEDDADGGQRLTGLGSCMAAIPADLKCAKLIIYGTLFSCLDACLTIAAILSTNKSPFTFLSRNDLTGSHSNDDGDLLLDGAAFDEWDSRRQRSTTRELRAWTEANALSGTSLREIDSTRLILLDALKDAGLVDRGYSFSASRGHKKYMQSVSGAKEVDPEGKMIRYFTEPPSPNNSSSSRVFIHPSSTLFSWSTNTNSATGSSNSGGGYLSFFSKVATSKTFVRGVTGCKEYGVLLFAGGAGGIEVDGQDGVGVVVDGLIILVFAAVCAKGDTSLTLMTPTSSSFLLPRVSVIKA